MIRFRFVDDARKTYPVKRLCEVLTLNRSSYYKWKSSAAKRKKRLFSDAILGVKVKSVFAAEKGCYGAKRVTAELNDNPKNRPVNHKRVARVMRSMKLFGFTKNARSPRLFRIRKSQCLLILSAVNSPLTGPTKSTSGHYLPADCGREKHVPGYRDWLLLPQAGRFRDCGSHAWFKMPSQLLKASEAALKGQYFTRITAVSIPRKHSRTPVRHLGLHSRWEQSEPAQITP